VQSARARLEARQSLRDGTQRAILSEIAAFHPGVATPEGVLAAVDAGLSRQRQLSAAREAARQAAQRRQLLEEQTPAPDAPEAIAPAVRRAEALAERDAARAEALRARRRSDAAEGRLTALGDGDALGAALEQTQERREALQQEYDALFLALEALERAAVSLQTRFSPALGRRAGEIFEELTGGRWRGVFLDRAFHAAATEAGGHSPRDAQMLSMGAGDQLYLAVRLAICELLLPPDSPLILDDALVRFDDLRLGRALEFLLQAAKTRQILLFTCQKREGAYLAGRLDVHLTGLA
jgi:uncharacterized protein YhaN